MTMPAPDPVPECFEVTIGPVAHGGHCVARATSGPQAGRVVFVRHALPGETVRARTTDAGRVWRADAVEVLANPSPYRVPSPWPEAGPGGIGGGELGHVSPAGQRRWKAAVLAEQMRRLAGIDIGQIAPQLAISPLTLEPLAFQPLTFDSPPLNPADPEPIGSPPTGSLPTGSVIPPEAATPPPPGPAASAPSDWGVDAVEPMAGYRTRLEFEADDAGRAGMKRHRSNEIVPLRGAPLATRELAEFASRVQLWDRQWPAGARLTLIAPSASEPVLLVNGQRFVIEPNAVPMPDTVTVPDAATAPAAVTVPDAVIAPAAAVAPASQGQGRAIDLADGRPQVAEQVEVAGRAVSYRLPAAAFWQVHVGAPGWLVAAVLRAADPHPGQNVLDLYAGSGLFSVPLADAVGPTGSVIAVEGSPLGAGAARANLAGHPWAQVIRGDVGQALRGLIRRGTGLLPLDVVVLDPPRVGAGRPVCDLIAQLRPARIVYVACDPAALARDTAYLARTGYRLIALAAADLFPLTHHLEAVATFTAG